MNLKQRLNRAIRRPGWFAASAAGALALAVALAGHPTTLQAQTSNAVQPPSVVLPLIQCWYNGKPAYYIQTDASDQSVAADQGVNFVPSLANAIDADAVDDIYHVTNYSQGNVIPSAPNPTGPANSDDEYTPLWQVSLVTWRSGTKPYVLKSEEDVLDAQAKGLVDIVQTDIVVNCPVIYTPTGGLLPTAKVIGVYKNEQK